MVKVIDLKIPGLANGELVQIFGQVRALSKYFTIAFAHRPSSEDSLRGQRLDSIVVSQLEGVTKGIWATSHVSHSMAAGKWVAK